MPGREWKPNRRERRILLVLMTGAPGLSGYPISRLAQTGSGSVYPTLARLEKLGWATSERDTVETPNGGRRRFYKLTVTGRENVARLLGIQLEER